MTDSTGFKDSSGKTKDDNLIKWKASRFCPQDPGEGFSLPSFFERRVGVELASTPIFPFSQVLDLTEKTWCQE